MSKTLRAAQRRDSGARSKQLIRANVKSWLLHIICVAALMWTPLANGQAFFFYDTSNYIRAADIALYLGSNKKVSTVWTDRYSDQLSSENSKTNEIGAPSPGAKFEPSHNNISAGLVMSGRSPYIGALMFLAYLLSNFWLFVILQAAISYFLIFLVLRQFGIEDATRRTITTLALAGATAVSYYNGLLLADAFAAFGTLSFLILASKMPLTKIETTALAAIIATSAVSHLTNIVILATLVGGTALLVMLRVMPKPPLRAWIFGIGAVALGFLSIQLTALATEAALGKKPQLLPLFTARFIADGPGLEYIKSGCEGNRYQICRVKIGAVDNASVILSGREPGVGTYLQANSTEQLKMGEEDTAFAWSVFRSYPLAQTRAIVRNTFAQLTWVEYTGLNVGCFDKEKCWSNLPAPVREQLQHSLSGRNAWPEHYLEPIQRSAMLLSLIMLFIVALRKEQMKQSHWRVLRSWLILTGLTMLAVAGFGGGIVEPQYRYITRVAWLLPFFALVGVFILSWQRFQISDPRGDRI